VKIEKGEKKEFDAVKKREEDRDKRAKERENLVRKKEKKKKNPKEKFFLPRFSNFFFFPSSSLPVPPPSFYFLFTFSPFFSLSYSHVFVFFFFFFALCQKSSLRNTYCKGFSGGIIRLKSQADTVEEWKYAPDKVDGEAGAIITSQELVDNTPITYTWDGMNFQPKGKSFGAGIFDGELLSWCPKEWEALKVTGSKTVLLSFHRSERERKFIPTRDGGLKLAVWRYGSGFLQATDEHAREWRIDGNVPDVVVMFIQMIRYARFPVKASDFKEEEEAEENLKTINVSSSTTQTYVIQPINREGYCNYKGGKLNRSWAKRFIALEDQTPTLYYWNSEEV
jgi:hypothetical protein